jgi:DNA gyrase subunit B
MAENENEQPKNSGEVDLYFQPVEDSDSDELKNLAENPRALTEDFKDESMADVAAASEGQDQFDTSNNSSYDEGDIQVLEGLEAVRKRPGMYIGDTTLRGLHHLIYEIVANSVDEALAGRCDTIDVVLNKDGSVTVTDDGSGIPVGNHPKLGIPTVEVVHTVLHAGGKFGGGAYTVSGGLHGVGASVVNALSSHMKVQVKREGNIYEIEFEKGKTTVPLHIVGTCDPSDTGTITNFIPDNEIFPDIRFDFDSMIT